jgi:hypothetical protein
MKKYYLFFFIVILSCCHDPKNKEKEEISKSYLNAILNDFRVGSSYLSIPLCNCQKFLIISNYDFFQILNKRKTISKVEYKNKIERLFLRNLCFQLSEIEFKFWENYIISKDDVIKKRSEVVYALRNNFDSNGTQIKEISAELTNFIIHDRFNSRFIIHTNDMAGLLLFRAHNPN